MMLLQAVPLAKAETLSFASLWHRVKEVSPAQGAAHLRTQSAEASLSRAENHWLPRAYVDARAYRTNDPGASLFGQLQQRRVEARDFAPDSLNHPEDRTYTRGALGLDLTLFEGGAKQAQSAMYRHIVAAEKFGTSQLEIEQYSQAGLAYGTIAASRKQKLKLIELGEQVSRLVKGYQLGQKSNPVGYSGLLGMKSLAIRISGLVVQLESSERASYRALREMGVENRNWTPQELDARSFTARFFPETATTEKDPSHRSLAGAEGAKALDEVAKMERARYLPRIGAFAESYVFNGSRDTADGYTAGLYLQWNLFDPSDFGKYKVAKLNALASEKMARAANQQESAELQVLLETERALRSNLQKLEESDKLLSEQTQVSSTLFRNGSIGPLQFVEILNRRTDLISQQVEAELSLLRASTARVMKTNFDIPGNAASEDGK